MNRKQKILSAAILMVFVLLWFGMTGFSASRQADKPVADEMIGSSGITWVPKISYARLMLAVSRPDGTVFNKTFSSAGSAYIDLSEMCADGLLDGRYSYELQAIPDYMPRVRKSIETAGYKKENNLQEPQVQGGYFLVRDGMIISSDAPERELTRSLDNLNRPMDQVIYDDLIVDGSFCVGNDCYSGYDFGFDTIVMMENNLRVYFNDTSSTSSFPTNDWRIVINDTTDGGGSYFALQDVTGGKTPFTVEAGAKTNSLYVDDDGQVGIGTSGPVFELHIREGDTPTVRLQQDNSYGWPEQIWDVGGNETSFFIRDGTHAAKLPFRIEPETPSSTLCLKSDGKVGIGTWSPEYPLEVETTGANAAIVCDRTDGAKNFMSSTASYGQFGTVSNHATRMLVNSAWKMQVNADNSLSMASGASCTAGGTWTNSSSRALKENIQSLDTEEALNTINNLNPVKFNYKVDKAEKHVGFIAEEAPELVATPDRKGMSPMDVVAVLTKVVQEQQKIIQEQQKFAQEQQKINAHLKKEIAELKKNANATQSPRKP